MEIDDTTDWMTEDDDDDWLMQDSPDLPSGQFTKSTVILTPPLSPRNIWEIILSFIFRVGPLVHWFRALAPVYLKPPCCESSNPAGDSILGGDTSSASEFWKLSIRSGNSYGNSSGDEPRG